MMVHRTRGDRGQLEIDMRLKGYGRFRCSAQTKRATVLRRRKLLAQFLLEQGQLDVLRAIDAGTLAWAKVEEAQKQQRLGDASLMADLKLEAKLWDAIDATVPDMGHSATTQRWYQGTLGQLKHLKVDGAAAFAEDATVSELERDDWPELLASWEASPATKNGLRRAVSRFLTKYLGRKQHPFRVAVVNEETWPVLRVPKRVRGVPADLFWSLMAKVPEHLVPSYVTLAASGMRVGEYLNDGAIELDARNHMIYPEGKTGPKEYAVDPALWPYVELAVPCRVSRMKKVPGRLQNDPRYRRLYKNLTKAGEALGVEITVHDLRRLYVRLGVAAVGESKTQDAVGHETDAMTRDYARWHTKAEVAHAVAAQLLELAPRGVKKMSGKMSGNLKRKHGT